MGKVTSPTTGQNQAASGGAAANSSEQSGPTPAKYKKVFIQRDYSQGTGVKYQTAFPPELEGYIEQETFAYLINTLNYIYDEGERMSGRAFCESCCACLSAYLLYLCMESFYDKCARKVSTFVEEQNDIKWKTRGLYVTDPIERGLRVIEITIYLDKAEQRMPQPKPQQQQPSAQATSNQNQNASSGTQSASQRSDSNNKKSSSHSKTHHGESAGGGHHHSSMKVSSKTTTSSSNPNTGNN